MAKAGERKSARTQTQAQTQRATAVRANKIQLHVLNAAISEDEKLDPQRAKALADQTGLTEKWIASWFTRTRKQRKISGGTVRPKTEQSDESTVMSNVSGSTNDSFTANSRREQLPISLAVKREILEDDFAAIPANNFGPEPKASEQPPDSSSLPIAPTAPPIEPQSHLLHLAYNPQIPFADPSHHFQPNRHFLRPPIPHLGPHVPFQHPFRTSRHDISLLASHSALEQSLNSLNRPSNESPFDYPTAPPVLRQYSASNVHQYAPQYDLENVPMVSSGMPACNDAAALPDFRLHDRPVLHPLASASRSSPDLMFASNLAVPSGEVHGSQIAGMSGPEGSGARPAVTPCEFELSYPDQNYPVEEPTVNTAQVEIPTSFQTSILLNRLRSPGKHLSILKDDNAVRAMTPEVLKSHLLDPRLVEDDPFQAAMGLVFLSQLGLAEEEC